MGQRKRFEVRLSEEQHQELEHLIRQGTGRARVMTRARILLHAHQGQHDHQVAAALHIHSATVSNIRRKFVEHGLKGALYDRPRPGGQAKLDAKQSAILIAETCSAAPDGHEKWTMQLLADRLIMLGVVDSISDETVRRSLKKTR